MLDFNAFSSTGGFIPHGHCYLWRPTLVWLHLISDTLIALAYYSIPLSLVYLARQRQDLPFRWVFWLSGAFIVACGTTHLLDVWTLWHPTYWVSGGMKALTALLSVATAVMLFRLLPAALQLPSQAQLEAANARLQAEIAEHERTEADLRKRKAVLREAQRIARLGNWEYDLQTQIITWSEELFRLFGLAPAPVAPSYAAELELFAPASRVQLDQAIQVAARDGTPYMLELQGTRVDGTTSWLMARGEAVRNDTGDVVKLIGTVQDISDRKQAEALVQASLKEKEVLLQEIHHRVKNNLQIVYSLLRLQRRTLKDPQAAAVLLESQNRIEAIALVHEKLYRAGDLAHIDASEYIPNLVVNLVSTYGLADHRVQLELAIEPLPLSMDCAVPCGLMINELISNAFKYAFPGQRPGQLTVSLQADTTDAQTPYVTLTVADNGVGLPAHVSPQQATTLGLQLVSDFVAQLKGTLQLDTTNGTAVAVKFPQSTLRQTPVQCCEPFG